MHKLTPELLAQITARLEHAINHSNWEAILDLDTQIRTVIMQYRAQPHSAALTHQFMRLKAQHAQAATFVAEAKDALKQMLENFSDETERAIAYQSMGL